jgi:D-beta-D-heptose 7-phosphate kinase/D-beta-D-heptose 1-phosphate adenosyltransferase
MQVLGALKAVDWVVSFSEDTPENLIDYIEPNVLVKGGDYTVTEIAGHKSVLKNGGEVKILQFKDGLSTSNIINKISKGD